MTTVGLGMAMDCVRFKYWLSQTQPDWHLLYLIPDQAIDGFMGFYTNPSLDVQVRCIWTHYFFILKIKKLPQVLQRFKPSICGSTSAGHYRSSHTLTELLYK